MMRVALDAGQEQLRAAASAMLSAECTIADVRAGWASNIGMCRRRWQRLAAIGLTSVTVPVEMGGLGGSALDLVPLLEEAGYVALPEPIAAAAVGTALLIEAAPVAAARWVPAVVAGNAVMTVGLPGEPYVDHAEASDVLVMARHDALHVVERASVGLAPQPSIDGSRRLSLVVGELPEPVSRDADAVARAVDLATLYCAAQLVGLGRRCLDLSVAYSRDRHQFGRPIGSYQALKHRMADDWTALEFARPVLWRAAWSVVHALPDASLHVSAAKIAAGEAASSAARTAVQVHGALGYTFECDVHLFLKRILALAQTYGDGYRHRRRLAETLRKRDIARVP